MILWISISTVVLSLLTISHHPFKNKLRFLDDRPAGGMDQGTTPGTVPSKVANDYLVLYIP